MEKQVDRDIDQEYSRLHGDYQQQTNIARVELDKKRRDAKTKAEADAAERDFQADMDEALRTFNEGVQQSVQKTIGEKPQDLIDQLEHHQKEAQRKTIEDTIRDHLRGFSRTIPSFIMIMAYGDGERVRHILREQVYGMAPTRIIYLIATNYILGFDEELKNETVNFVQADAAAAAKEDRLAELVEECFGGVRYPSLHRKK